MISIILYGRNDNYGYNLHKRAALSLNCMAEVLTAPDDEILFVDYNTPDDFPTFPEAIRDTLTPRAQAMLRILRVRPSQHARFQDRTHLKALEPISRNVALRRSNPGNRWILSTNTDMIFVPRGARSLSGVAADLDGGYYHLPRFEIPEYLWETLDRSDPAGTIAEVARWGWSLHLNEVVSGNPTNRYDAPGDFQLGLRDDLVRVHGFEERMLIGWHVDSNIAARMSLLYGRPDTLIDDMFGYHCDHTRQATPMHSHNRIQNDWVVHVDHVMQADIPSQADSWGLAGEEVEEVRLSEGSRRYLHALHKAVGEPMRELTPLAYTGPNYDRISYDARHVLPFLLDAFTAYPRGVTVAWFGARADLLQRFAVAWEAMGQTGPILIPALASWLSEGLSSCCRRETASNAIAEADILVFDFGLSALPSDGEAATNRAEVFHILHAVELAFRAALAAERRRMIDRLAPRRLIAVNTINNRFSGVVDTNLAITQAPIATRLRQGFVLPVKTDFDLLPLLFPGPEAGETRGSGDIAARPGVAGVMLYGLYRELPEGRYRLNLTIRLDRSEIADRSTSPLRLEILGGPYCLAARVLSIAELCSGEVDCLFDMPEPFGLQAVLQPVQIVVTTNGSCAAVVTGGHLSKASPSDVQPAETCEPMKPEVAWLPMMCPGETVVKSPYDWQISLGEPAFAAYGPYQPLLPGHYEAVFLFQFNAGQTGYGFEADVFVLKTQQVLAHASFAPAEEGCELLLKFEVVGDGFGTAEPQKLEFRLFTHGRQTGRLLAVNTRRLDDPACHPAILAAAEF